MSEHIVHAHIVEVRLSGHVPADAGIGVQPDGVLRFEVPEAWQDRYQAAQVVVVRAPERSYDYDIDVTASG